MFNKKTKLKLTGFECNLLINGMNEFRNKACSDGIPTEDVDELLLKIINQARLRKGKYHLSEITSTNPKINLPCSVFRKEIILRVK